MEASNKNNEILGQSNLLKDSTDQKARGVIPFEVLIFFFSSCSWPYHVAGGILFPRLRIKTGPPALDAQSLNHWMVREILKFSFVTIWLKENWLRYQLISALSGQGSH